jgi:transcriptional regulator with XRE-family HTH domain
MKRTKTAPVRVATTYAAIVGMLIIEMRNSRKKQQSYLAKIIGVTQSTWSRIENGTSPLSVTHLATVCWALNDTPEELLKRVGNAVKYLEARNIYVVMDEVKNENNVFITGKRLGNVLALPAMLTRIAKVME